MSLAACSGCGSNYELAVVQAGGGREFIGPLRVLVYCANCRGHPERAAPCREAVMLAEVTEDLLLRWYREGKTVSAPDIVAGLVFGEERAAFIAAANKAMDHRREEESP